MKSLKIKIIGYLILTILAMTIGITMEKGGAAFCCGFVIALASCIFIDVIADFFGKKIK